MKLRIGEERERDAERTTGVSQPYILTRSKRGARDAPSLAIKFDVDTDSGSQNEGREFAEYLREKTLFIECWDGDSLHSLGVMALELAPLMRQGDRVAKVAKEFDVVDSNLSRATMDIHGSTLPGGRVVGKVQLIVSNYGYKSSSSKRNRNFQHPLGNEVEATGTALTDGANWRVKTAFGTTKRSISKRKPQYRTRARPLAETNAELGRLLRTNTSQYARNEHLPTERSDSRWSTSDSYCLTGYEIREIIEILDEDDRGEINVAKFYTFADITTPASRSMNKQQGKIVTKAAASIEKKLRRVLERAEEEGVKLRDSFAHFDKNDDGKISRSEMRRALAELGPDFEVDDDELDALLLRFDEDGDGSVSYIEFVDFIKSEKASASFAKKTKIPVENLLRKVLTQAEDEGVDLDQSFKHFDKDGDGRITRKEMRKALGELGPNFRSISEADFDALLERFDENGDGSVSYKEFISFVKSGEEQEPKSKIAEDLRRVLHKAEEEGVELEQSFAHFDTNGDGLLSKSEIKKGLAKLGPNFETSSKELDDILDQLDEDGDGEVSYLEFIRFAKAGKSKGSTVGKKGRAKRDQARPTPSK